MYRTSILASLLVTSTGLASATALTSMDRYVPMPERRVVLQAATPKKNTVQKGHQGRTAQPMFEWLESHQNLSLDQQEKALERDPRFKRLPPARQAALRDRLRKFNSLTPDQRQLALKRMEYWASLTPGQRQELRDANHQLQGLSQDRRIAVHKALRHLRKMNPQKRQQVMESDRFKTLFSEQEQGILKELAAINPPHNGQQHPATVTQSPKP
ncbi:MAG TPA: DUF3106 domain-containing protein [Candidatus Angelobacter sp.]|nr:DUF3106 domain-containing protein [Candidatus Angelobacter sp.]